MQKLNFKKSEVLSYIESKIIDDIATEEEMELYQDFKWDGTFKMNYTYKKVLKEMKGIQENGY